MSLIKRLSTTITAQLSQVVGEIENHDAIIQANLNDMSKKVSEAKVQLSEVQKEKKHLQSQIQSKNTESLLWQKRAIESVKTNEEKALECVKREQHCQKIMKQLEVRLNTISEVIEKLTNDVFDSEQILMELKQKQKVMRARQSSNKAFNSVTTANESIGNTLQDSFDRWEISIGETKPHITQHEMKDDLEKEFIKKEEIESLRKQLNDLIKREDNL